MVGCLSARESVERTLGEGFFAGGTRNMRFYESYEKSPVNGPPSP